MTDTRDPHDTATALLAEARESGRLARQRDIASKFARLERTPIPRRALLVALSGKVQKTESIAAASRWADLKSTGTIVFAGPVGTGKTVAAAWYACMANAEWAAAPMLGLASPAQAHAEIERLRRCERLVLDEVGGQGTTSPHAVERLATLLSHRHGDMRGTAITTNLNRADFARLYDGVDSEKRSRLLDRIDEDGLWLNVTGDSRRSDPVRLATGRVDLARSFVRLCEHAEAVSGGQAPTRAMLDELQRELGLGDDALGQRIDAIRASRSRVADLARGLIERIKYTDDDGVA